MITDILRLIMNFLTVPLLIANQAWQPVCPHWKAPYWHAAQENRPYIKVYLNKNVPRPYPFQLDFIFYKQCFILLWYHKPFPYLMWCGQSNPVIRLKKSVSCFWHDNDKDLKVCFLVTRVICVYLTYQGGINWSQLNTCLLKELTF